MEALKLLAVHFGWDHWLVQDYIDLRGLNHRARREDERYWLELGRGERERDDELETALVLGVQAATRAIDDWIARALAEVEK
jgi:hypothetical protein